MRSLLTLTAILTMTIAGVVIPTPAAVAVQVPETLTDRRPVQAGPVEPDFPIDHVGVIWDEDDHDHGHAEAERPAEIRFRTDGVWSPWRPLIEDGAEHPDHWASGLAAGDDADAYQIRGIPEDAERPRAVALNTTDGELRTVGHRPASEASAIDRCLSRAEWGADESLRYDDDGDEIWPPEFYDVQTMTVHHTATDNDDPDPESTVRAIYEYHAVDQGWGDIGYHYLIDEDGRVYEGRWSGEASSPCDGDGDGTDFAHASTADDAGLVTAGHTGGYNSGNMGAALLGEFTTHPRFGAEPQQAAVDALEALLAEFASRHDLDPHDVVDYVNPVNGDTKTVDMISGHRDWKSTECPGERLYEKLPDIRDAVADQMSAVDVAITHPADGADVDGTVDITAGASSDAEVTQVEFLVDGTTLATDSDGSDGWSAAWDTTDHDDGEHTVTATATDGDGDSDSHSITVTVDNVADPEPSTMHVGDLDATTSNQGKTWTATVTVLVHDTEEDPVSGTEVTGTWTAPTGSGSGECTTGADGTCQVAFSGIHKHDHTATYAVEAVSGDLTYDADANHDPDGDSDGTTIQVTR